MQKQRNRKDIHLNNVGLKMQHMSVFKGCIAFIIIQWTIQKKSIIIVNAVCLLKARNLLLPCSSCTTQRQLAFYFYFKCIFTAWLALTPTMWRTYHVLLHVQHQRAASRAAPPAFPAWETFTLHHPVVFFFFFHLFPLHDDIQLKKMKPNPHNYLNIKYLCFCP